MRLASMLLGINVAVIDVSHIDLAVIDVADVDVAPSTWPLGVKVACIVLPPALH